MDIRTRRQEQEREKHIYVLGLDIFTRAYLECALWSSTDEGGEPLDSKYSIDDLALGVIEQAEHDCKQFRKANQIDLAKTRTRAGTARNGHDFWLTRNHHGVGFWDRGYGDVGRRLTDTAHTYGEVSLYLGDDGLIHSV